MKAKKREYIGSTEGTACLCPWSSDGRAVRGQTCVIMIAIGLTKVVITNAVEEDHQHGPCHEEQNRGSERIDQHADLEPGLTRRQPIDR